MGGVRCQGGGCEVPGGRVEGRRYQGGGYEVPGGRVEGMRCQGGGCSSVWCRWVFHRWVV